MSTLADKARAAKEQMAGSQNPADSVVQEAPQRRRIPMTLPQTKLSAPDIPGYHTHWMAGTPERLQQAYDAGYELVDRSEVKLNESSIGGDGLKGGNTDMGTCVSKLANPIGGEGALPDGQPLRLYLMKQKLEWYEEDQKILQARNDSVVDALTASFQDGTVGGRAEGETTGDVAQRYVGRGGVRGAKIPELFRRKKPS